MSCAKFECVGWVSDTGWPRKHGSGYIPADWHKGGIFGSECRCRCGLPWSAHSDAARGVEQPAQEAALPPISKWVLQDPGFMVSDAEGDWCEATTAEAWRTEAIQQRARADGLEGERAELLKRVAERDGWVCELRERAEEAEAELRAERWRSWQQARQAEIARYCNERAVESEWLTIKERNAWADRARDAEAECLEQARLLGMGGEREAALLGKAERLEREMVALKAQQPVAWTWIEDGVMHEPSLTRFAREPVPGATALYAAPVATVTQAEHAAALRKARWEVLTEAAVVCRKRAQTYDSVNVMYEGYVPLVSAMMNGCAAAIEALRDTEGA